SASGVRRPADLACARAPVAGRCPLSQRVARSSFGGAVSAGLLGRLTEVLVRAGIPYMVVGSFASTFHGLPRTTQDLDLVIDPTPASLAVFLKLLPEDDYYVSPEAARDALARRAMFNVIDIATGWKVDLIVRRDRPFSEEEFRRRAVARLLGHDVYVAS